MFVNSKIQDFLGYKPGEFVLASENGRTGVYQEVQSLIEVISQKSRGECREEATICRFHSKREKERSFAFDYQFFKSNSSPHPFILVSLTPVTFENKAVMASVGAASGEAAPFWYEGGGVMHQLMEKMDTLIDQEGNILFRGDVGTGKKTLARTILKKAKRSGMKAAEWNLPAMSMPEQNEAINKIAAESRTKSGRDNEGYVLLLIEIEKLSIPNQKKLLAELKYRASGDKKIRIIATTTLSLEDLVAKGEFMMDLYYYISFDTLLLPPLSQRGDDLASWAKKWMQAAGNVLNIADFEISQEAEQQINSYSWPGNFPEFFTVMRRFLARPEEGEFAFCMDEKSPERSKNNEETKIEKSFFSDLPDYEEFNRRYFAFILEKTGGRIYGKGGAAEKLKLKPTTFQSKLKRLGMR